MWQLSVLNAGGRDEEQDFPTGPGAPADQVPHPPVNYHAYAACTHGSFHARTANALATGRPILLLLRRDLAASLRVLRRLKAAGRVVAVTFKEAGAVQLAGRLGNAASLRLLTSILETADGFIAPTLPLQAFLAALLPGGGPPGAFIPTPYPLDDSRWDFSRPAGERRGIFIGTREFAEPARQHLAAVLGARAVSQQTGTPVTVINTDGRKGTRLLAELGFSAAPQAALRWLEGPLIYPDYLREMARHRVVFQLDRIGVPGQVAGDALLCGLPCLGGDGAIEQLAFPEWCGQRRTNAELLELLRGVVDEPARGEDVARAGQQAALATLSYGVVAPALEQFFDSLTVRGSR